MNKLGHSEQMLLKFSNVKCSLSQLSWEHLLVAVPVLMILVKRM